MIIQVPDTKKIQKLSKNPICVNEGFFNEPTQKQEISGASKAAQQGATYLRKLAEESKIPEIEKFLKYYDITNYEIECTGKGIFVDVNDNLYLPNKKLTGFPGFKFRNVQGTCNFSGNRFTDFSQFPRRIEKSCLANFNYIKSFQNAPEYIGGNLTGVFLELLFIDFSKELSIVFFDELRGAKFNNNFLLLLEIVESFFSKHLSLLFSSVFIGQIKNSLLFSSFMSSFSIYFY